MPYSKSYHTKSNILHQISPIQSNNLHHPQSYHRNFFTFLGFNSKSDTKSNNEEEQQQQDENLDDGFSEEDAVAKDDGYLKEVEVPDCWDSMGFCCEEEESNIQCKFRGFRVIQKKEA